MKPYQKIPSVYKRDEKGKMLFGQYSTSMLKHLKDAKWLFTEKINGINIRVIRSEKVILFRGRTEKADLPHTVIEKLGYLFGEEFLKFPVGTTLYGEMFGPKIQKGGGNYGKDINFSLFDVWMPKGDVSPINPMDPGWWLRHKSVVQIASQLHIAVVPTVSFGTLKDMEEIVSGGFNSFHGPFEAEGIVGKPTVQVFDRMGDRVLTKLKAKDFRK